MKKMLIFVLVLGLFAAALSVRAQSAPIILWPPGATAAPGAVGKLPGDIPQITPFLPTKDKATGAAVIVLPGGGYGHLSDVKEGSAVAEWLNNFGVTVFVLKYRLGPRYHQPAPLLDAARAMRTVRARAKEWNIDPARIGILGFSAGRPSRRDARHAFRRRKA